MSRKSPFIPLAAALFFGSCNTVGFETSGEMLSRNETEPILSHEMIELGDRLENPYTTENMREAYASLYGTKSRTEIQTTSLYVRFLPSDDSQFDRLKSLGLEMTDYPLDYQITRDGDYYHDPEISDESITWQYAVVDKDFSFPSDIRYEVIDECFLTEFAPSTRASDSVDWEEVEKEAYRKTGNDMLLTSAFTKGGDVIQPSGRICIVDEKQNGGTPFGVSGVCVKVNSFVKISRAYTDRDGYYTIPKSFSSNPHYRLVFDNDKGFAIGVNLILVPASTSALGKGSPEGMNVTVTKDSDRKLFLRCVANNAVYDYFERCGEGDLNIKRPASDLRLWLFKGLDASSSVMIHQGAIVENKSVKTFLGPFAKLLQYFAPDITIGTKDVESYSDMYSLVTHELAHASHFAQVGNDYWEKYIHYILTSYITSGGMTYGTGVGGNAGYCAVGEIWAYYLESRMYKDRYGGTMPPFGTSYWFYPQIFRYLEERGFSVSEIFMSLQPDVTSMNALKDKLTTLYPNKSSIIDQVFSRFK